MKKYIQEMLMRKDLLIYLVKSGLKAEHRNSYLGYFWWLLDPLLNVLVYYFLVVIVLQRGSENYPLFLVIGLVVWRLISSGISASSKSILRYSSIINQVYLPKAIFPMSFILSQLFNFLFGLVVVGAFLLIYGVIPSWEIIFLPLLIVVTMLFLFAIGLVLGYINVFVRDIDNVLTYVTRVLFYASPIIWEGGRLGPKFSWAIDYNPIAVIVESYRAILMHGTIPNFTGLGIILLISLVIIVIMINHYSKNEHKIIKAL
ncbi:ABC transporter permease [Ornithinibacillus halophilus]|uniref:Transport permease protein n=1 Tax=Ornithinibacillus halophilus TaxID=930117 RepID=A0A1M5E9E5_9BACI|nr:ABC transporter permease [Ornithinibacillus halophilus]SHF75805.1 lipopolysaccharide transport system permease protein/teichoic acid transport system permease protein [Ornithinibacillus halophilus]